MSECVITEKNIVDYIESLKKQLAAAEKERNEWKWLFEMREAHNAVLISALEKIADLTLSYIDEPNNDIEKTVGEALATTPADSAERVKVLVELLQDAVSETENGEKLSVGFCLAARKALAGFYNYVNTRNRKDIESRETRSGCASKVCE